MYFLCSRTLPKDCQMLLFSATYDDEVMKFAKTVVPDPIIIRLRREEESLDNIKQYYVVCRDKEEKFQALSNMYGVVSIGQCIVFCHVSVKRNSFPPPLFPFSFSLIPIQILPRPRKRLQSSINLSCYSENSPNPRKFLHFVYACVISDSQGRLLVGREDDSGWSFSSAVVRRDHSGTAASSIKQIPRRQGETADNNQCQCQRH